jgi:hypothetical protein
MDIRNHAGERWGIFAVQRGDPATATALKGRIHRQWFPEGEVYSFVATDSNDQPRTPDADEVELAQRTIELLAGFPLEASNQAVGDDVSQRAAGHAGSRLLARLIPGYRHR